MGNKLAYETPTSRKALFSKLGWATIVSVFEHILVFGLYAATLDGGALARMCAAVSLGFWLLVLVIVLRRRRNPSPFDLAFVAFGYPVMLFACIFAVKGEL